MQMEASTVNKIYHGYQIQQQQVGHVQQKLLIQMEQKYEDQHRVVMDHVQQVLHNQDEQLKQKL